MKIFKVKWISKLHLSWLVNISIIGLASIREILEN